MVESMEIRLHGRGGQGGVTCAKILAACYAAQGRSVQTFGDYAGERSGAPVRAYTRVSDTLITNRNKVYEPDHLLVLDSHLLGPDVFAGLRPGGTILVNTAATLEELVAQCPPFTIGAIDATRIAREHRIGTRAVVIVNTTIAGAFARMHDVPLEVLRQVYGKLGFLGNFAAAEAAWSEVRIRTQLASPAVANDAVHAGGASSGSKADPARRTTPAVMELADHRSSPPTPLKTGNWSSLRPQYTEQLAPCNAWCPAGNDVIGFVQSMHAGDVQQGAEILSSTTPLPGVCGRVCPAPCMEGCNRAEFDGAVNIRGLERFIADSDAVPTVTVEPTATPGKVAIVGSGPAGLTAAYVLAQHGHAVTIYDGERQLGGVLRTGIPTYRLPREVLDREVARVLALGVEARTGRFLDRTALADLPREHDAVILATGLQQLTTLEVPGATLAGVEQGIGFLHRVNVDGDARVAGHVVVLGGGNTAMDCARSALRSGADRVTVVYRRTRKEMPAIGEEVDQAVEEGVELALQWAPVAFHGDGKVSAVELAEVEMGPPDDSGRRRPVVTERTRTLPCDHVLLAIGQRADTDVLPAGWELRQDRIFADGEPLAVFAAGDVATGEGTVTHAIGSGRRAADLVMRQLGAELEPFVRPPRELAVPATDIRFDHFAGHAPDRGRLLAPTARARTFAEADAGLATADEAHRCFSCGHCTRCDTCLVYCPEGIIRRQAPGYEVDYTYCKGCGICVTECPRAAMELNES
ncbi:MAG: FAD-dependent oxidoreductase [Planctomycetes bacterium]|nr:FAD-dependent oxidoreductase [Planctomycetota bacterium]